VRLEALVGDLTEGVSVISDICLLRVFITALDPDVGLDLVRRCPFLAVLDFGLFLSLSLRDALTLPFLTASTSKSPLRKSGSPRSSESSLRSPAAPSRSAWLVFSMAFLSPMSDHKPVAGFFSKKRPGGFSVRTASTMDREIAIFCLFVLVTYNS